MNLQTLVKFILLSTSGLTESISYLPLSHGLFKYPTPIFNLNIFYNSQLMFYVVMGLENAMLMFVWIVGVSTEDDPPWYRMALPMAVFVMFCGGLGFMWLYYRYFHVRRLKYEAGGRLNNNNNATADNNAFVNSSSSHVINFKCKNYSNGDKVSMWWFSKR